MRSSGAVLQDWVRALQATEKLRNTPDSTLASVVQTVARTRGAEAALIGAEAQLTYDELAARIGHYGSWARAHGLAAGDVVALLMPNQPDYVAIWLGLTQAGCVVALLNTHIVGAPLAHCIRSAAASHVIVAATLIERARAVMAELPATTRWWAHGEAPAEFSRIDIADAAPASARLGVDAPPPRDHALLIYTSGTTGLPKAAHVGHAQILEWSAWFAGMMNAQPADRLYDCLPMYHSVGGVVAVGAMLSSGGSVVIRDRFSASRFWGDVAQSRCTIVQYIGELCRYLLQSPPHKAETGHAVRLFCGNGLRGDVWPAFQDRFKIPRILEFYAATEGGVSLYNCEGKPGAIGRVPPFLAHRFPVALIQCDADTGEVRRDAVGRCIPCAAGEAGEAIGRLRGAPADIYTDPAASARKILHDVFAAGDRWFRTGDLLRKDAAGFYYFVDRLGDTFRWRGENVSTTEVAAILGACPGVTDALVYGVEVPGAEGKAGMAALVVDGTFSLKAFRQHVHASLPAYARPLFVRLCGAIETTATFKPKKADLARDGYAGAGSDPVWFDDAAVGAFVPWVRLEGRKARAEPWPSFLQAVLPASTVITVPVTFAARSPTR